MTDDLSTPAGRLKYARQMAGYRSARAFLEKFGHDQSTYSGHETGGRGLKPTQAALYAKQLNNCSAGWLLTAEGNAPLKNTAPAPVGPPPTKANAGKHEAVEFAGESYASVAVYEAAVSAGPGSLNADQATPLAYNLFRRDWLRGVTRVGVENLAILKVYGDSMAPTLLNGDDVLVDMSVKHIGRDGLYVLAADHEVQVKRVSRSPLDKSLSISSDNPAAQSWAGVSDENVFVLGRVIWLGRTI